MQKIIYPLNADSEGNCRCIKAGYYKMGSTNFIRAYVGGGSIMMDLLPQE